MTHEELMRRLEVVAEHLTAIDISPNLAIGVSDGCGHMSVVDAEGPVAVVERDLNGVWRVESYRSES